MDVFDPLSLPILTPVPWRKGSRDTVLDFDWYNDSTSRNDDTLSGERCRTRCPTLLVKKGGWEKKGGLKRLRERGHDWSPMTDKEH